MRVVVCDPGLGNLRSVVRAVEEAARRLGSAAIEVEVSPDPARVRAADKIVLPGQAGFAEYSRAVAGPLGDAVRDHLRAERPYLGICMGLQVLFGESEEAPGATGLGLVPGKVVKLGGGVDPLTDAALKIPHIGWNVAEPTANRGLLEGQAHFYFVHSYAVVPRDPSVVASWTEYGARFVSSIAYGNVFACQFHPEKSQAAGLALLGRFLAS